MRPIEREHSPARTGPDLLPPLAPVFLGDTWEWNGASWSQRSATGPSARSHHAMVYDRHRGRTVLFGGFGWPAGSLGDTWEWNGSTWTRVATSGPAPRHDHAMAPYYFEDDSAFLFGGRDEAGNVGSNSASLRGLPPPSDGGGCGDCATGDASTRSQPLFGLGMLLLLAFAMRRRD